MSVADAFGSEARQGRLDIGGRGLAYVTIGDGAPAVVFVAGAGDSCLAWANVAPIIGERCRAVAYDRAGLGASDPGPSDITTMTEDLARLIEGLGAARSVVVGHSLGGAIAERLGWSHPDLVAGLVLVDPTHEALFERGFAARAQVAIASVPVLLARIGALASVDRRVAKGRASTLPIERRAAFVDASAEAGTLAHARAARAEIRGFRFDAGAQRIARSAAGRLGVPVTVLSATKGAQRLRRRWTELQAQIVHSSSEGEHRIIQGSSHVIQVERPDAVIVAIKDIILRLA